MSTFKNLQESKIINETTKKEKLTEAKRQK
jgi:hypothetical protein